MSDFVLHFGENSGMIKSDSPTSWAANFWGRASEKLLLARPRTSIFSRSLQSRCMSFKQVKINNWLLNTRRVCDRQVAR